MFISKCRISIIGTGVHHSSRKLLVESELSNASKQNVRILWVRSCHFEKHAVMGVVASENFSDTKLSFAKLDDKSSPVSILAAADDLEYGHGMRPSA